MSYYREVLEKWLSKIDVDADKVLDIGGGEKPITERVHSWKVNEYRVLDNDPKFKPDILQDMNLPLNDVTTFDVIFCLEVAEYIYNPVQLHGSLSDLLSKDGILYISYPTIYPTHNPEEFDYLRYSKRAIEKYMALFNLGIEEIIPRKTTVGTEGLWTFYSKEKTHALHKSELPFHMGYLVKAIKHLQ